jgi:lipoprotein-releasing system permease protein
MLQFKLAFKFLNLSRTLRDPTAILAIFGMVLGVGSLIVSISVFSGFETALKSAIVDVVGHVTLTRWGSYLNLSPEQRAEMKKKFPDIIGMSPYISLEAIAANKGKISGIRVEGLQEASYKDVLNVDKRVIRGEFHLEYGNVLIGKGLAKTLGVGVGDTIKVILPKPSPSNTKKFSPRVGKFQVAGILDLGKHDYNERIAVMSLERAQELAQINESILGLRIKVKDPERALAVGSGILKFLGGYPYKIKTWHEINQNLLDAIQLEKIVIFLVVLILVVAACFNVASTLYVRVINRYSEISILKSMGGKRGFVVKIFALQGLLLGGIGATGGIAFGVILAKAFKWAVEHWELMPADVYKIEVFTAELRITDLSAVFAATFLVCFLSTLLPALRGSRLNPCEGLRYE